MDSDSSKPQGRGEALFIAHLATIERAIAFVVRRHHLSATDADDLASDVKLKLIERDYAALANFAGRSSLQSYIVVIVERVYLDWRIAAWGKWRPSAEARRSGAAALLLERLTVRDGLSFDEAYEVMTTNHGVTLPRAEVEALAARLPTRPKRRFESDDALETLPVDGVSPDEAAARDEHEALRLRVAGVLRRAGSNLNPQDRLLLAMRFEDGRSVAEISRVMQLEQKALYRRYEKLLKDLRRAFEAEGIGASDVARIIGRDLPVAAVGGIGAQRPSHQTGAGA